MMSVWKILQRTVLVAMTSTVLFVAAGCTTQQVQSDALKNPAFNVDGFIQQWAILDPISVNGLTQSDVRAAVEREYFADQLTVVPSFGDTVMIGGEPFTWHQVSTRDYNVNLYYFAKALGKPTSNVLFWVVTVIDCPAERAGVRLAIGSNAASIWWVNGEEVIGIYNDRQTVIDDGVSKLLTLKEGRNIIRGAVVNAGGATDFCARFLDAQDKPITGLAVVDP